MKPYYDDGKGIVIYHGDNREVLPLIGRHDLLLTDPPYGIGRANGMGGGGGGLDPRKRLVRKYEGGWDEEKPGVDALRLMIEKANKSIIWGGNYFTDLLPQSNKWLVWDKVQTMPSYSDAELAWTNLEGNTVTMFRQCGAGMLAVEKDRFHPTQKPLALMKWCLSLFPEAKSVLDPFLGSGTTAVACKDMGLSCTGIEAEERYCEIAANRLRQEVFDFA